MPAKRPASFLLTPQYRVDALWLNGAGPEVKAEAPKFAQFNPPPAASTEAPPEPQAPVKAETAKEQSAPHANPPAAAATMDLWDLTSGRRRKHAAAERGK